MARWISALLLTLIAISVSADCGVERWPVKTGTDADTAQISPLVFPVSIAYLRGIPAVRPLAQANRVPPVETTTYGVTATLTDIRRDPDGDYDLVLSDASGNTLIAEVPSPDCTGTASPFRQAIASVRAAIDSRIGVTAAFRRINLPVEVEGVGFFDFLEGQTGAAPNGIEIHPVTEINFNPPIPPAAPRAVRRRAAMPPTCTPPSLTITLAKAAACPGEPTTISWQASDPGATVSIGNLSSNLSASGATLISSSTTEIFTGSARNSCGSGYESTALLTILEGATAAFDSVPAAVTQGTSTFFRITTVNTFSWTLISSLGNTLSATSGTGDVQQMITYTANVAGNDTITLTALGSCGAAPRSAYISVGTAPPPPPPPSSGGLRCCDGTLSPTCFSCANKQGCCSHHGGVCGCP
jgi:hypothetical protein